MTQQIFYFHIQDHVNLPMPYPLITAEFPNKLFNFVFKLKLKYKPNFETESLQLNKFNPYSMEIKENFHFYNMLSL